MKENIYISILFQFDKGWGGGGARPREDDVTHRILEEPTVDCRRVWAPEASLCDQHLHRQTGEMQNKPICNFTGSCFLLKIILS